MKLSRNFHEYMIEDLKNPLHSKIYLQSAAELAAEDNDPEILDDAIEDVFQALGITKDQINIKSLLNSIYSKNVNELEKVNRK